MTSFLSQIFRTVGQSPLSNPNPPRIPMLNEITRSLNTFLGSVSQIRKKKALMAWYKQIPELTALVNKVARDIVYRYHFETINPTDSGRNKILTVNKFATEVQLRKTMLSQVIDILITGEGFGWMGKVSEQRVKEIINNRVKKEWKIRAIERKGFNESIFKELKRIEGFSDTAGIDEDLLRPRKYRGMASSTIEIIYNQIDILSYSQIVGINKPLIFKPSEIIRYTFMDVDGRVSGFTPVEAILVQLELARQMWQNQLALQKNGGHPDKAFIFENARMNDPSFKRIEEQLQKYKIVENKHGIMTFTGKVKIEDLQQLDTMQFKDQGLYITGVMAMQWEIPKSSIPFIVGGANTKGDVGGNAEKGYWRNVEICQYMFAETMNTQLWIPHFGVKIVFDNTFVQQDVQIQTAQQMKLNNLMAENQLFGKMDKVLSMETLQRELGRDSIELIEKPEGFDDVPGMEEGVDKSVGNSSSNSPKKSDTDTAEKRNISKRKKDEQTQSASSQGKPTGVSKEIQFKEWDNKADTEFKNMMGQDVEVLPLNAFIQVYLQDKSYHSGMPPRVFMRTNPEMTSFKYKSSDFIYITRLPTETLEDNSIILSNLDNVFRL